MTKPRTRKISIKVDAMLYKAAAEAMKQRGTDIDVWFDLQLRAFATSGKYILTLKDKMTFGKYMGANVEDVVRGDLSYATWMVGQDYKTKYGQDVLSLVTELNGVVSS